MGANPCRTHVSGIDIMTVTYVVPIPYDISLCNIRYLCILLERSIWPEFKMRLSGLQKEVLSLYRNCLRETRKKPAVRIAILYTIRGRRS